MRRKVSMELKGMAVVLFAAAVSVCGAAPSIPTRRPVDPDSARFDSLIRQQWAFARLCTDVSPEPGGDLTDVIWVLYPDSQPRHDAMGNELVGEWIPPDTIYLDTAYRFVDWVIRHELLHHLLRGPPPADGGPHPWHPFAYPCHAMAFQHR